MRLFQIGIHGVFQPLVGREAGSRCGRHAVPRQPRSECAGIQADAKQRGAQPRVRDAIAMRLWDARDESVQPQAAQIIAERAGAVLRERAPLQRRHVRPHIALPKAGRRAGKRTQCVQQGQDAPVPKAEPRRALAIDQPG